MDRNNDVVITCFPGEVSQEKLSSVKTSDKMGVFKETKTCSPSKPELFVYQHLRHGKVFFTFKPGISSFFSWKGRTDAGPLQDGPVLHDGCSLSARVTEALDGPCNDLTAFTSIL